MQQIIQLPLIECMAVISYPESFSTHQIDLNLYGGILGISQVTITKGQAVKALLSGGE